MVFEGLSGSGKSESIIGLTKHLEVAGINPIVVEWNTNRLIRSLVRNLDRLGLLNSTLYSLLQWLGFFIDYVKVISPALRKDLVVIADRYIYTAITRDEANGVTRGNNLFFSRFVREPDWVLYCDTNPKLCYERILKRGKRLFHTNRKLKQDTSIENKELYYLELISKSYVETMDKLRERNDSKVVFIQNEDTQIHEAIQRYIRQKMKSKRDIWESSYEKNATLD